MNLPREMSHTARDNPPPPSMRGLWVLIILLLLFGTAGLVADILTARTTTGASKSDARAIAGLVTQVKEIEEAQAQNVEEHRIATDEAHAEICRIIESIAQARDIPVDPCVFERLTHPRPTTAPAASPR